MRQSVDRHFAGSIAPDAERALREHLPTCEDCHRYYERHLLLATLDPKALDAEARLAQGLGLPRPRRAAVWSLGVIGLAAAAAAIALVVAPRLLHPQSDGFTPRGPEVKLPQVHLSVFRVEKGAAVPVADRIGAADELAFAYENRAGKQRLMVYGVDEHRHVYWFFPAWQDPATDPEAIRIEAGDGSHELREAVAHHFDGGQLTLHALFTDSPLKVRDVERWLERGEAVPDAVDFTRPPLSVAGEGGR
jgi:hypothetical protein